MSKFIPKNKPISSATAWNYAGLLADIKQRIRTAQVRTAMAGNASNRHGLSSDSRDA
jgi:hypothetical protein